MKVLKHIAVAAILATPVAAQAELTDVGRSIAGQRACQAAIWAMPAVSTWDIRPARTFL